jgi:hypothetical protein
MVTTDNDSVPIGIVRDILNHIFERVRVADDDDDINELENIVRGYVEQFNPKESSSPEQIRDLEKEFSKPETDNSDAGTSYQSREDVPEQARDLWDIMHNDEAINSMRRGM